MTHLKIIKEHLSQFGKIDNDYLFNQDKHPDLFNKKAEIEGLFTIYFSKYGHSFGNSFEASLEVLESFAKLFNTKFDCYKIVLEIYLKLFKEYSIIKELIKTNERITNAPYEKLYKDFNIVFFNSFKKQNYDSLLSNVGSNIIFIPMTSVDYYFHHLNVIEPYIKIIVTLPINNTEVFYYKYEKGINTKEKHYFSNVYSINNNMKTNIIYSINNNMKTNIKYKEFKIEDIEKIIINKYIKKVYLDIINQNKDKINFIKFNNEFEEVKKVFNMLLMIEI